MMENLRRFVWKAESLSGTTKGITKEKPLPAIPEEHDVSSHHSTEQINCNLIRIIFVMQ
jgi:hypothetical protein